MKRHHLPDELLEKARAYDPSKVTVVNRENKGVAKSKARPVMPEGEFNQAYASGERGAFNLVKQWHEEEAKRYTEFADAFSSTGGLAKEALLDVARFHKRCAEHIEREYLK